MQTFAAMDIGSNSMRLLVADWNGGEIIPRYTGLRTVRLAEGVKETGQISPAARERAALAMDDFCRVLDKFGQIPVAAVATSAVRDSSNGGEFIRFLSARSGIPIRVIDGNEEARLSYRGVSYALQGKNHLVVLDIGGGSTEVVWQDSCQLLRSFSVPLGAVNCTEQSLSPSEILAGLQPALDQLGRGWRELVAVGGTATTLAAIHHRLTTYDPRRVQGTRLTLEQVAAILFDLARKSLAERKKTVGLQAERADIIVAGTMILWVAMSYLKAEEVTVSEADLLYGLLLELASSGD